MTGEARRSYDVIVAGAGGMGSAAAYHLARRGARVLVLDPFALNHDRGSSHGLSRIIRLAYFEHPSYVPLLRRAFELWRALERDAGTTLLHVTGGLDVGPEGSAVLEGSRHSCVVHELAHEVLSATVLARRFPAWASGLVVQAVFQPDAGFLVPEVCIAAHVNGAQRSGADVRWHEAVRAWTTQANGVRVETDRATYEAGQLVLAAGAWTPVLAPLFASSLTVERQVMGWFAPTERALFQPARFPVFVLDVGDAIYYGFPEHAVPGFKIGRYHHRGERVTADTVNRHWDADDEAALREGLTPYFPSAAQGPLVDARVCLFTNTPDGHFVIDRHPDASQVLVVSPCSGHGFKFCSVIGEIVGDLILRGETAHDISLFKASRLLG